MTTFAPAPLRRRKTRRVASAGIAFALSAALLSACAPGTDSAGGSAAADTIVVGSTISIRALNPLDMQYQTAQYNAFESLVRIIGGGEPEPGLATDWNRVDDTTWDFTIREGVTFHDGTPLTVDDVVFSFNETIEESFVTSSVLTGIDTVTALDDSTVRITTKGPDALLLNAVGQVSIVPKALYEQLGPDGFAAAPVGTGPYTIGEFDLNTGVMFHAYEGYWGEAPKTPNIDMRYFSDPTSLASALESGQVDVAHQLGMPAIKTVGTNPDFVLSNEFGGSQNMMQFNSVSGPFADERVREAANAAINIDELIEALTYGAGMKEDGQLPLEAINGYTDTITRPAYDPEKAKRLLAEAGAEGAQIKIAGLSMYKSLLEAVGAQLAAVGFEPTVETLEIAVWSQQLREGSSADIFYKGLGYVGMYDADRPFSQIARGSNAMVADPAWDELYQATRTELDEDARREKIVEASEYILDKDYVLWTYSSPSVGATTTSISGIDFSSGLMLMFDDAVKTS
ncbi:ABC transporter substrate-binding protein [Rhodococcus sp. NPDC047139]|uniref:ABC transporter substrate-binding protein n=1 Tax=Rhodococcus sp. NPDC047139 TaxID=3155141 RepID=UPI00340C8B90